VTEVFDGSRRAATMDRTRTAGVALTALGMTGYLAGVAAPYSGRAFAVTGIIVGVTLASVGTPEGAT
jgi:hypothetical protein